MKLDRLVAIRTGWSERTVGEITAAFLDVSADQLVRNKEIVLAKLGKLRVVSIPVNRVVPLKRGPKGVTREVVVKRHLRVDFSKSSDLKKRLEKHHGKARRSRGG